MKKNKLVEFEHTDTIRLKLTVGLAVVFIPFAFNVKTKFAILCYIRKIWKTMATTHLVTAMVKSKLSSISSLSVKVFSLARWSKTETQHLLSRRKVY